jgi:hypothetical protein
MYYQSSPKRVVREVGVSGHGSRCTGTGTPFFEFGIAVPVPFPRTDTTKADEDYDEYREDQRRRDPFQ